MSARVVRTKPESRRSVRFIGTAALFGLIASATGLVAGPEMAAAAPNGGACAPNDHFGRLVPDPAGAKFADADLTNVGAFTTETNHLESITPGVASQDESDIDAGYTYVGQFIDHDITLDERPDDLSGDIDPWSLVNLRTPQLDLDSVYGKGPAGSPELYEADGVLLKLGARQTGSQSDPEARDVYRGANGQAILGDARNDENRIVGSLHSIVTRFHNKIVRDVRAAYPQWSNSRVFTEASQQVRWYYQWAVLTDFLPQMSSQSAVDSVAKYNGTNWTTNLSYYDSCRGSIPTEFAVASYRWHTMVRDDYVVNDNIKDLPIFDGTFNPRNNLAGFQPAPSDFGFDWDYFFSGGDESTQKAYKLDNSLVPSLGKLPGGAAGAGPVNLSVRNLLRGNQLRLPSGQDMARAFGVTPLRDDQILVGPALAPGAPTKAITEFSPTFAGKAPLWSYLFAESVNQTYTVKNGKITSGTSKSIRLGPVGAKIVNETLVGLLANDPTSVINHPEFKPDAKYLTSSGKFQFKDLIRIATTRTDAPKQECTTTYVKPALTIFNWWYYALVKPVAKTTCAIPVYPNPKTTKFYTKA